MEFLISKRPFPQTLWKSKRYMFSEGGTGENQRINPHLDLGNFVENNNNIWKNWFRSSSRLKIFSDPHLDKIRSALTENTNEYNFK